jgi:hypothetical protein
MRYVIAMIFGLVGAAVAGRFVGVHVTPWVVQQFSYSSPDEAASVEQFTFIAVLACGLALGWVLGWIVGAPFSRRRTR